MNPMYYKTEADRVASLPGASDGEKLLAKLITELAKEMSTFQRELRSLQDGKKSAR